MAKVNVWLSHDGYSDPDDNLAILVGSARLGQAARSDRARSRCPGVVFGDTKDGGQYYMLHPTGKAPRCFGTDSRYGNIAGNKVAAGNYEFYLDYGKGAIKGMAPGWKQFDMLAADKGGLRAWNFDATSRAQITVRLGRRWPTTSARRSPAAATRRSVYSAGGGANVRGRGARLSYEPGLPRRDDRRRISPSSSMATATGTTSTRPRRARSPAT